MIEVIFTPVYIGIIVYRFCHTLVLQTYILYILLIYFSFVSQCPQFALMVLINIRPSAAYICNYIRTTQCSTLHTIQKLHNMYTTARHKRKQVPFRLWPMRTVYECPCKHTGSFHHVHSTSVLPSCRMSSRRSQLKGRAGNNGHISDCSAV